MTDDERKLFVHVIIPKGVVMHEPLEDGSGVRRFGMTIAQGSIYEAVSMLHQLLSVIHDCGKAPK